MSLFDEFDAAIVEQEAEKTMRGTQEDVMAPLEKTGLCKILGSLDANTKYIVRMLPPHDPERRKMFVKVKHHYFKRGKPSICPETFGETCPACAKAWQNFVPGIRMDNQGPKVRELLSREDYYWPCLWINGKDPSSIYLLRAPKSLHIEGLYKGEIKQKGNFVTGKVIQELSELTEELKKSNEVPPEITNPHFLHFYVSKKYGRLIRVSRQGIGLASRYDASVYNIDKAYEVPDEVIRNHIDWTAKFKEVLWDNFDWEEFNNKIEATLAIINNGDEIYDPSSADDVPFDIDTAMNTTPEINTPKEPEKQVVEETNKEPEKQAETKSKPKANTKKEETTGTAGRKKTTLDTLTTLKMPPSINGTKREVVMSKFIAENVEVADEFNRQYVDLCQSTDPDKSTKVQTLIQEYKEMIVSSVE